MSKSNNLIGYIYNSWQVVNKAPSKRNHSYWVVKCTKCGVEKNIQGCHLRNNTVQKCSCLSQKNEKICPICRKVFTETKKTTRKFCYECSPYYSKKEGKSKTITAIRRAIKKNLVLYKGGKCQICSYDKCIDALQFHHKNPSEKDFSISQFRNYDVHSIKKYYEEVDKCDLLCANCHFEIHSKFADVV